MIGALLAALAGIFIWNRSLNRLAERRGRELTEESIAHIAAAMKVGERTRLAIELHDALSQNLTGVSLEIVTAAKFAAMPISQEIEHFMEEDPPVQKLTQRQSDILASLVRGLTNDDIAKQFSIQRSSVKDHLTAIFEKLGAANRSEAVSIALRKHLLKT